MKKKVVISTIVLLAIGYYLTFIFKYQKTEYYDTGEKKKEYYVNVFNEVDGILREYYKNGNLKAVSKLDKGIQNGVTKTFFETGELKSEMTLVNGELTDTSFFYTENGLLYQKKIVKSGVVIEYDEKGREIKRGTLSDNKFSGYTTNYSSISNDWYQLVNYENDSLVYILINDDPMQLLNRQYRFTINLPSGSQSELIQDDTLDFHLSAMTRNIGVNVLVVGGENRVEEIAGRIKKQPVDSLFEDVIVNYKDERKFSSYMIFHHSLNEYFVDFVFYNNANTYWVNTQTSKESFSKNPMSVISIIESFTISELEITE